MSSQHVRRFLLIALLFAIRVTASTDTLDFTGRLGSISPANILTEPGYYVWCGSGIQGEDGRYYLFYSRWKAGTEGRDPEDVPGHKDMRGWIKYCEIAAAVSDSPTGPYRHVAVVLRGTGYPSRWDQYNEERGLSPQRGALALITSERGWGDWRPAAHNIVSLREYTDSTGQKHTLANLERPQLIFDDAGRPICLFAAAGEKNPFQGTPSFNLQFAIRQEQ